MKKLTLTIFCLALPSMVLAQDTPQISLVKKIYQEAKGGKDGLAILKKHADKSFSQVIRKAQNSEDLCIDADPIWNSQDPQFKATVKITGNGNQVAAQFKQYGENVTVKYVINCAGNSCKVSDVDGLKSAWQQCY